jgi:hypothetical protein
MIDPVTGLERLGAVDALRRFLRARPPGLRYAAIPVDCPRAGNVMPEGVPFGDVLRAAGVHDGPLCGMVLPHAPFARDRGAGGYSGGSGLAHVCLEPSGHPGGHGWSAIAEQGSDVAWVASIDPLARILRRAAAGMPSA